MGFAQKIIGFVTGNGVEVDANNQLKVALPALPANAGYAKIMGKGAYPTAPEILQGYDGRQVVAVDNILFKENVDAATVNINRWLTTVSGMTVAATSTGFIVLNSGNALTAGAYALLQSRKFFQLMAHATMIVKFNLVLINCDQVNMTMEAGLGTVAAGVLAPTDGGLIRITAGAAKGVANYNGTETQLALSSGRPANAVVHECKLIFDSTTLTVQIDDVIQGTVDIGNTNQAALTNNSRQQFFVRLFNASGAAPSAAPQVLLGNVLITQGHLPQNRSWSEVVAMHGLGAYQAPTGTYGQTANHANSAAPTSVTLSNTTPGYTTLGGKFQFAAVAGAATDYVIFAYQVPLGHQLKVQSISISTVNTGAAVATTATILDWAVGVNCGASSAAQADSGNTLGPRRVELGLQSFIVGAGIGAVANDLVRTFYGTPLVVDSNNYLLIILQMPVGTATAAQVIRGDVTIEGSFE